MPNNDHRFRSTGLIVFLLILFTGIPLTGFSYHGTTCWVVLSDKEGMELDPFSYFDKKAIDRRLRNHLPLVTYSDLPVRPDYVKAIHTLSDSVIYVSRWMNAVVVVTDPDRLKQMKKLPFVSEIWLADELYDGKIARVISKNPDPEEFDTTDRGEMRTFLKAQTARMNGAAFLQSGIDGKGVRVAIFDIGFKSYKTHAAFKHLLKDGKIIQTWDFARKKENVDGYHSHGTTVLSCIAGFAPEFDLPIGLATGAEFLLAITETRTEWFKEEVNWLAAAEWADKNGADVINSSLGYTYHRYFRYQMDGKTSFVARAAAMASSKGILVVNSAGNEGTDTWKNIGTPADVEEVLSVGGIAPWNGLHTSFSSFGPTWDKRLKPNVTAYGHVIGAEPGGYGETQGTSFSGPLVAGFVACVMQLHPDWGRQRVFDEIQQSADLYPYFDYAHGYGVPRADYFTTETNRPESPAYFKLEDKGKYYEIVLDTGLLSSSDGYDFERYNTEKYNVNEPGYLYYHVENSKHYLDKYFVIALTNGDSYSDSGTATIPENNDAVLKIYKSDYAMPFIIRVLYKGQMIEVTCEE